MANEVGRVEVRVLPNTKGFALRTKEKLRALNDQTYQVKVDIDQDKFQRDLDSMVKQANRFLAKRENHLKFRTDLGITKRDARAQVSDMRETYQDMADNSRPVRFDAKLGMDRLEAQATITPYVDQTDFSRDLSRAVRRSAALAEVTVWGDRQGISRQAEMAAEVFRERLAYANRDIALFGDKAKVEEQALAVARSTKLRLKDALKEFNIFGAPKDIEDQTSNAIDVFKRKWREAQGELNIRADLEYDKAKVQEYIDLVDELTVAHSKGVDKLNAHTRGYHGMVAQMRQSRIAMSRLRREMERMDPEAEGYAERWEAANTKQREHGRNIERLKDSIDDMAAKLRTLKMDVELDATDLVDAQAELDRFRAQAEMHDIELNTDIKTAASEAALAFLTRPRVVEIRTKISNRAHALVRDLKDVGGIRWGDIGRVVSSFATRSTGLRMMWQTARDIVDIVPKLDMMIPALAQTMALGSAAVAAAGAGLSSLVSIGVDMMKAGQSLLIAPAGLAGVATLGLVFVSAWERMEDHVPEIEESFAQLKDTLGADFWTQDAGRISGFFTTLFAGIEHYSPRLTKATADITAALTAGLMEAGVKQGPRFMENLLRGLGSAEKGFKSLGSAIMGLVGAGSDSFESLGKWFTGVMGDFDQWVKRNDANGNITRWINEGAQAIRDIGSLIYSTGSMFATFASIVKEAGGPSLSDFAAGMRHLAETMKSPGFRGQALPTLESMFNFVKGLGALKPQLLEATVTALEMLRYGLDNLSGPVTDIFGATLAGFNDPIFMKGFEQFIDGMGSFLTDIAPGWQRFVAEFGGLFGVVGEGAKAFGPAFNEMLLLISDLGSNIHPGLESFLRFIGPELEKLLKRIGPAMRDVATGVSDLLANKGFQQFLADVGDKLGAIGEVALEAAEGIIALVGAMFNGYNGLPGWMQDLVTWTVAIGGAAIFAAPLIKPLLMPLGALFTIFRRPLGVLAEEGILGAVERLSKIKWGPLARNLGRVAGPIGLVLTAVTTPFGAGHDIMATVFDWLGLDGLANMEREIKARIDKVTGGRSLAGIAWDTFKGVLGELKTGDVIGAVKVWAGGIGTMFKSAFTTITTPGQVFVETVMDWFDFESWPGYLLMQDYGYDGSIRSVFTSLWTLLRTPLNESWDRFMGHFREWEPTNGVGKAMKYIAERVPGLLGFDENGNWSWDTLTSSWKSFASGAWNAIKTWLGNEWRELNSKLTNWEPDKNNDTAVLAKKVLTAVRELAGFDDQGNWSWSNLTSAWGDLAGKIWPGIKSWLDGQMDALRRLFDAWEPKTVGGKSTKFVMERIPGLLGFDKNGNWSFSTMTSSWKSFAVDAWTNIKSWLDAEIDKLWTKISSWTPVKKTLEFGRMIADWIAQLFGYEDAADARKQIEGAFEDAWEDIKACLNRSWNWLRGKIEDWSPTLVTIAGGPAVWLGVWVAKALGIDEGWPWDCDDLADFWDKAWHGLKRWLQEQFEKLMKKVEEWSPVNVGIRFATWLMEKLREHFFNKGDEPVVEDTGPSWWDRVKGWFQKKWDELLVKIHEWAPVNVGIRFATWLREKLEEYFFGKDDEPVDGDIGPSWWEKVKGWFQKKWEELIERIQAWRPERVALRFATWLGERIRELFTSDEDEVPEDATPSWWERLKGWVERKWEEMLRKLESWSPRRALFRFGVWLGKKIRELFGGSGGGGDIPEDATPSWWEKVKAWLERKWEELVTFIEEWNPVSIGFRFGSWLGRKIRDLFGNNNGDLEDDGPLIDWEHWKNRIKEVLTRGLVALGLAIMSPAFIVIAPIVLGTKLIEWLFGDGENDRGAIRELYDRIIGLWGPIKEALLDGIEELGRLVGGIVHDVICLPQYILDEIFVDCFDDEGMVSRVGEKVGRWGNPLIMGVTTGMSALRERLNGLSGTLGMNGGAGEGLLDRLIGVTPGHIAGTTGNLERLVGTITTFANGVAERLSTMSNNGKRSIKGLADNTDAEFGRMERNAPAKSRSMGDGVVEQYRSMASRALIQVSSLVSGLNSRLATGAGYASSQGRSTSNGYIAQMRNMSSGAVGVASTMVSRLRSTLSFNASGAGATVGNTFRSGLSGGLNSAVAMASGIAGRIRSVLSFSAFGSGASVGGSFASGLSSRIRSVTGAAAALAAAARRNLPNSPAKEGPFSGKGWGGWGESIGDELARGIKKAAPVVAKEAEAMMAGVHGALDSRSDLTVGASFENTRKRYTLTADGDGRGAGTTVNVNVESRSEDPLRDGNRFGGDIAFALRGAGLA